MRKIKVGLYGIGVIGSMIGRYLLEKEGLSIVCAIDIAKDKIGKDLGQTLGSGKKLGITVSKNVNDAFSKAKPDVVIHATSSFLKETFPQIASIVKHGVNVVSTCEELSYPYTNEPQLANQLDKLAKKHDATVLGTGINPGFLMDALVIMLTAPCQKIDKIEATRVMDASTRRLPFQKKIGAGLTIKEFEEKINKKQITGHVGLEQSISMIAAALEWKLDKVVVEAVAPVIATKEVKSKEVNVEAGNVAGIRQKAKGIIYGKEAITLDFQAYIGAKEEYDSVNITGVPYIKQKIQPCVHGDIGTIAMVYNMIPKVLNAPSGLVTMKDLPIPCAVVNDVRKYVGQL
ncbi:MAG: hypothetical protein QXJ02_04135 [Candidatus Bathyarchaeia archaeon]